MFVLENYQKKRLLINNQSLKTYRTPFKRVLIDLIVTLLSWRIWVSMGWQDVKLAYRRTKLGPWWITLTTFIFIGTLAFIFGNLLHSNQVDYLPHLATGYVAWALISSLLGESPAIFSSAQAYILQMNLPYTLYVMRVVFKYFVTFLHNLIPALIIASWYGAKYNLLHPLQFLVGILIIVLCGLFYGTALATIGAKIRDLKPGIQSLIRVFFYMTPIMWMRDRFPEKYQFVVDWNPFYHLIELMRRPLLGQNFTLDNFLMGLAVVFIGFLFMLITLWRFRHRIAFWV